MKKLLIFNLLLLIINLICIIYNSNFFGFVVDFANIDKCDTIINRVLIDSITYDIKVKDSIILNIKTITQYEIEQANNISDDAAVELFKRLVSE